MIVNVLAAAAAAILLMGGMAVLTQCNRAEMSWRAASGFALLTAGAVVLVDLFYDDDVAPGVLVLAVCMSIPVARLLVPYKESGRRHERRVTGLGMLDSQPLERKWHDDQHGGSSVAQLVTAVVIGIFFALVYGPSMAAEEKPPCDPREGTAHVYGMDGGCLWAAWVCKPADEFADYSISMVAQRLDSIGPDWLITMSNSTFDGMLSMRTERAGSMQCLRGVRDRIDAIRPPSAWVVATNAGRRDRPVYHRLDDGTLGAQYITSGPGAAVAPVGWPCDATFRAVKGSSIYGRPRGWKGDMVTLCRKK